MDTRPTDERTRAYRDHGDLLERRTLYIRILSVVIGLLALLLAAAMLFSPSKNDPQWEKMIIAVVVLCMLASGIGLWHLRKWGLGLAVLFSLILEADSIRERWTDPFWTHVELIILAAVWVALAALILRRLYRPRPVPTSGKPTWWDIFQ